MQMTFYQSETFTGILLTTIPALASMYFYFIRRDERAGLALLLLTAFVLRLLMISLDPYVQSWDESFQHLWHTTYLAIERNIVLYFNS